LFPSMANLGPPIPGLSLNATDVFMAAARPT
jgi:hypothetical protein